MSCFCWPLSSFLSWWSHVGGRGRGGGRGGVGVVVALPVPVAAVAVVRRRRGGCRRSSSSPAFSPVAFAILVDFLFVVGVRRSRPRSRNGVVFGRLLVASPCSRSPNFKALSSESLDS